MEEPRVDQGKATVPIGMVNQGEPRSMLAHRAHTSGTVGLGLLFFVAGASKAFDPWSFHTALPDYGISGAARTVIALVTPALEVLLGTALLLRWRVRGVSLVASALLAVFVVAIGFGWWRGTLEECGCFGAMLERSPGTAIAIDVLFLGVGIVVWRGTPLPGTSRRMGRWLKRAIVVAAGLGSFLLTMSLYLAGPSGVRATEEGDRDPTMQSVDLNHGEHLLYLFHPECPLCAEMSPLVAEYGRHPELPDVAGFTALTTRADVDAYRGKHDLRIPVRILSREALSRITGDGWVPQLVLVREGDITRVWRTVLPDADELRAFFAKECVGSSEGGS